jgi:hypothetical protein
MTQISLPCKHSIAIDQTCKNKSPPCFAVFADDETHNATKRNMIAQRRCVEPGSIKSPSKNSSKEPGKGSKAQWLGLLLGRILDIAFSGGFRAASVNSLSCQLDE